jgi:hypothetical protein
MFPIPKSSCKYCTSVSLGLAKNTYDPPHLVGAVTKISGFSRKALLEKIDELFWGAAGVEQIKTSDKCFVIHIEITPETEKERTKVPLVDFVAQIWTRRSLQYGIGRELVTQPDERSTLLKKAIFFPSS